MTAGADTMRLADGRASARRTAIAPPLDRERLFAAARRRSGRVRLLRRAILLSVVGAAVGMIAIAAFDPFGPKSGSLTFSSVALDGTKVSMARPRLAGFRSDGQPYVLTAERALQDLKHPTVAELQNLVGDMGTAGGETTRLTADAGLYDSVGERMKLNGNVKIDGARFQARLRSVDIDFKTGVYDSDEPVEVHLGGGTSVVADRASARNNGQELIFEGRVRTTVIPQGEAPVEAHSTRTNP
ncbi:lipopolysaccharide export system protein LptC [Roseiarcus fermentans]|uniref:Lipopolysaccharide export system protein LptC n=1 Tax=Roseiarcus fermentans TaxID=1473586 RepID=A0A366FUB1_9HYPH|nr:LPS export ABC transporter periplasmic protein LptC [Roseiarcus fermentans]RBP18264.1 lipopolysaccharide export system protein LptC [Roseiarcus fermentans]